MTVTWFGHACFLVSDGETRVLTDPFNEAVGYPVPSVETDVVLVSHDHFDHANAGAVKGSPVVFRTPGTHEAHRLRFAGVPTFHDDSGGAQRGKNVIFRWEMGTMLLAHCGDLGEPLTDEQAAAIGDVDVLFVPIGGVYTIDPEQAEAVSKRLSARVVFPMHYLTDVMDASRFPLAGVDDFLQLFGAEAETQRVEGNTVELSRADLPDSGVKAIVLDYK